MRIAEKETPYSLRMQVYLSVQSASLVLDGPDNTQVRAVLAGPPPFHAQYSFAAVCCDKCRQAEKL